ncbi:unnamed protein product [Closterium sp. NIES-54]
MAPILDDDGGEAADEPPNHAPSRIGLDFLRGLHQNPPPVCNAGASSCGGKNFPPSRPAGSSAVELDSAPATVILTEVDESSSAASKKKRRFAEAYLPFGTPPAKPTPPPTPVQAPSRVSRELTRAEKAEEKFWKAQQLYVTQWLPKFEWLLLDKNEEGLPILRCSICVEHGKDDAKFGRNGTGGRDLQLGSMRCHELSVRHDDAMKRQRTLMAGIEKQKRIDDFASDRKGPPIVPLDPARSAFVLSGPARIVSSCPTASSYCLPPARRTLLQPARLTSPSAAPRVTPCISSHVTPCCPTRRALPQPARRALLQPVRRALLPYASRPAAASASRPTAASASRSAALRVAPCCNQRVAPYYSQRVALCCPARRALLQPACHALLPLVSRPAAASASRPTAASASCSAAPHVALCCPGHRAPYPAACGTPCLAEPCPAATTAAAAARATGAFGAGGATGSARGAVGAGGARPTTDRHCLSWPISRQLQRLGVDSGGHCLSWTTSPLSSFASGFFSELVQVVEAEVFCVLHRGGSRAAALGASESATALGATESAAALGASESAAALGARASHATGPSSAEALHTFTLDSGASCCFFRDCTTLTPLAALVPVSLTDSTKDPVVARASTVLPCPAVPFGSLSGLHLPTFSMNLVSNAAIQDVWDDTFIPGVWRVAICTLSSGTTASVTPLYRISMVCTPVSLSLAFPGPSPPSRARLPRHAFPALRGGSVPLLTPHSSKFPPTTAPLQTLHHSPRCSSVWGPAPVGGTDQERYFLLVVDDYSRYTTVFPLRRKADVNGVLIPWIRATCRQLRERFNRDFLVLRLHSYRGSEFSSDLLAEFCRDEGIVRSFTLPASPQQNGITERCIGLIMEVARTFMIHAAAPHFLWPFAVRYAAHQLNLWPRVSEPKTSPTLRWTGKVGDASVFWVWGTLSIVRDAKASKLSSRTLRCVFLGFPNDAPPWQFYHPHSRRVFSSKDVTFDKSVCFYRLHPHASHPIPLAPLFFVPVPPPVHPLPPQGPTPSSVSQVHPSPLVEPLEISSDSSGPTEGGDPAADDTTATRRSPRLETPLGFPPRPSSPPPQFAALESGAETAGAEPGGAETEGEGSRGAVTGGADPGGAAIGGATNEGANSGGLASPSGGGAVGDPAGGTSGAGGTGGTVGGAGGAAGARGTRGAAGAGGAGATSPRGATSARGAGPSSPGGTSAAGGVGGAAGDGGTRAGGTGGAGAARLGGAGTGGARAARPGGARTRGAGAARAGGAAGAGVAGGAVGSTGTGGARGTTGARGPGAVGASGAAGAGGARGAAGGAGAGGAGAGGAGAAGAGQAGAAGTALRIPFFYPQLQSSLPTPDSVLCKNRAFTLVRARRVARPRPPAVPGTHSMTLRPSSVSRRVVVPEPPASSLLHVPDPESDLARAAIPTVTRLLATVITDPYLESTPTVALVTELVDFAARSRFDDVASLIAMDAEMASWKSTSIYVDEVPPPGANIVDGMWIFTGVDIFQTFSPTPKMTTLWVLLYVAAQRDYELHSLDFSTIFLHGSLHEEIWPRRPPGFTGSFPAGTQTTLAALGFAPSSADPLLFLRTDTTLPPFYVLVYADDLVFATADTEALALVLQRFGFQFSSPQPTPLSTGHSLSAPPSDESVEPSGPYPELVGCLMYLMTCTRPDLAYPLSLLARYVAPGRHRKVHWDVAKRVLHYLCSTSGMGLVLGGQCSMVLTGHSDASWADDHATQRSSQEDTFSLGFGSVSWRSTRSSSVLSSSCEAGIYAGAMAAQELR